MAAKDRPSVSDALDLGGISMLQWAVFALCALVALLDGWDTQSIGIVAPLLRADLKLNPTELGAVFSMTQAGATVGALAFGPLADRFGRKPLTVFATALVAVFTYVTALSHGYWDLMAYRAIVGVGLAGALPCVLALASEYAPKRIRGLMVTTVFAAYPLGGALGGFLNAWLVTAYDWRMVFYLGGILPALVCAAIALWMPESMQLLALRGVTARVEAILRRLHLVADPTVVATTGPAPPRASLKSLFTGGLAAATLLLWAIYFFAFATTKIMVVWFPSILKEAGLTVALAGAAQGFFNLGTAGGMAISGKLVDRFGPGPVLTPALVICSLCVFALGSASHGAAPVFALATLVGIFLGVGACGANAVAVQLYAPAIRSTGLGFGLASSRFGQVLSPMMVGVMLTVGAGAQAVYATVAALPLLAGGAALILMFQLRSTGKSEAARTGSGLGSSLT